MESSLESIWNGKIVSGGQTGVDRAALDVAIELGIDHGGWCPRGRLAEDGPIDQKYQLVETESDRYPVRTEQNVIDSDATLLIHRGPLAGGTRLTYRLARRHARPLFQLDVMQLIDPTALMSWVDSHSIEILNIAGPRESTAPGIYEQTVDLLRGLFRFN